MTPDEIKEFCGLVKAGTTSHVLGQDEQLWIGTQKQWLKAEAMEKEQESMEREAVGAHCLKCEDPILGDVDSLCGSCSGNEK